jgi:hypothetical protein
MGTIYGDPIVHPLEGLTQITDITVHDRAAAIEGNTALLRKLELLANVQKASPILKRISTFIFNRIQKNKAIRNSHLHAAFQDTPLMEILEKSATTNNGTLSEAFSSWQDSLSGDVFDEIITIALADNPILATLRIVARIQTLFATASDTNSNTVIVNQMLVLNPDLQGLDFTPSNGNLFDAFSVLENEVKKLGSGVTVDHSHANTGQLNLLNTAPTIERVIIFYKKISQNEDIKNKDITKTFKDTALLRELNKSVKINSIDLVEAFTNWHRTISGDPLKAMLKEVLDNDPAFNSICEIARLQKLKTDTENPEEEAFLLNQALVDYPELIDLEILPSDGNLLDAFATLQNRLNELGSDSPNDYYQEVSGNAYYALVGDEAIGPNDSLENRTLPRSVRCHETSTVYTDSYSELDTYVFAEPVNPQVGKIYLSSVKIREMASLTAESPNYLNPADRGVRYASDSDITAANSMSEVKLFDECIPQEDPKELVNKSDSRKKTDTRSIELTFNIYHDQISAVARDEFVLTIRSGKVYLAGDASTLVLISKSSCSAQWGECRNPFKVKDEDVLDTEIDTIINPAIDHSITSILNYLGISTKDLSLYFDESTL